MLAWRRWALRLGAALLIPLLLLGSLELGLRWGGFGYSTAFFLPARRDGQEVLIENARFGWRFVPSRLARTPQSLSIPARKPADTIRVFVLGESAAMGDPEPAYGFPRILRVLLEERFPGRRFEVVNTAMTAINSHVILPIARECARRQGDIWVVYMGNNEVGGPFGLGTIFSAKVPNLAFLRANLALKTTRIGQLLEAGLGLVRGSKTAPGYWGGMEMFAQQQVRAEDARLAAVYDYFRKNLADILEVGSRAGAKIVVTTMVSNLKDCAPFGSLHAPELAPATLGEWEKFYREGCRLEGEGKLAEALESFKQAAHLDPDYAELQFRLGRSYYAATNYPAAQQAFQAARDLDTLRFRADTKINGLIREGAADRTFEGIHLVDAAQVFAAQHPQGITGQEFVYEHVHLNFGGNYLLARIVADQIASIFPESPPSSGAANWLSGEACAERLALTDWNRYWIIESLRRRLQGLPFRDQFDHQEQELRWQRASAQLRPAIQAASLPRWEEAYRRSLERAPDDWVLHYQFGRVLESYGQLDQAEQEWRAALRQVPQHIVARYQLARLLNRQGNQALAIQYLEEVLRQIPYFPEALNTYGIALAHQGKFDQAYQQFAQALEVRPDFAEAQANWGLSLVGQSRTNEALPHLQEALRLDTNNGAAHFGLAKLLAQQGQEKEALIHFERAFQLQPKSATNYFIAGSTALNQGRTIEALAHFTEAIRLDSKLAEAHHKLGALLAHRDRLDEAAGRLAEAARLEPDSASVHFDFGVALARQLHFAEAIAQFRETLRLDPTNQHAQAYIDNAQNLLNRRNPPNR